jgi:two-component system, NarL family, sensor kinase
MDPGETEIFSAILLASGILAAIIICFIILVIRNHKKLLELQHRQLITEITALEYERKRIVSDLHDELGPLLAVVKFQIESLDTTLKQDIELIGKTSSNLDGILRRIREICNHMMPDVLTRKGLFKAVNEFIEQLYSRTSMDIIFTCQPAPVSPQTELHVYRMIQEMTNNAIKHSGASRLRIDINIKNEKLVLEVSDDGIGFNANSEINQREGLGIKNIFGRTTMLNGDMYLTTEPGQGTVYKIEIPIRCNEPQDTIDDRR